MHTPLQKKFSDILYIQIQSNNQPPFLMLI